MPTYLCHGFRWQRRLIRIFVILENIDEGAPDWIIARGSSRAILQRFATKFDFLPRPTSKQPAGQQQVPASEDNVLVNDWSPVKLLEEYDPEEMAISARPFAYVADYAIRVDLSAGLDEEKAKYEAQLKEGNQGDWFERLRDELQAGEPIGWYVVVCGDEERFAPRDDNDDAEEDYQEEYYEETPRPKTAGAAPSGSKPIIKSSDQPSLRHKMSRAGLRRLFGKKDSPIPE
ncbi:hypothetical protein PT974_00672 [Cladobotryum mycophilum]|uniref:Developmental regulator protein n=1 Tax=Cladobotryum mycophilum TaxID=491253 RepID=A0ABR0T2E2_9HYPO